MRVTLVSNRFAPSVGGVQSLVMRLGAALQDAGHHVSVLTHQLDDDPEEEVLRGVLVRRFRPTVRLEHATVSIGLLRAVGSTADDIVHLFSYHDVVTQAAAVARRGPLVVTTAYHGSSEGRLRSRAHVAYRRTGDRVLERAERIVCLSEAERTLVHEHFPSTRDRTRVIPCGIDVDAILAAATSDRADGRGSIVVIGRLDRYKRVDRVVRAMSHLCHEFRLDIFGAGEARAELEVLVGHLGLAGTVEFRGRVSDAALRSALRSASVVCSASALESQGIVPLEAIVAGAGVALSDIPAHRETAYRFPERCVLFSESAQALELAEAIRSAAGKRGASLPGSGPESWDDVAAEMEALYQHVCRPSTSKVSVHR